MAPVLNGQPVGMVKVALEGKPVAEFPMIALEEVPLGEPFRPRVDTVRSGSPAAEDTMLEATQIVYLNGQFLPLAERRSRCSTAASSTATASTKSCRSTGAGRSGCRSISRACSTASTAFGSPTRTDAEWEALIARSDRAPAVRRPGACTCRSRAASPSAITRFPQGVDADGVHDEQPARDARRASRSSAASPW